VEDYYWPVDGLEQYKALGGKVLHFVDDLQWHDVDMKARKRDHMAAASELLSTYC